MLAAIKLTSNSGRPIFVDVHGIGVIETAKDGTSILHFHGKEKTVNVKEDPITVISSIQGFFANNQIIEKEKALNGQSPAPTGSPAA